MQGGGRRQAANGQGYRERLVGGGPGMFGGFGRGGAPGGAAAAAGPAAPAPREEQVARLVAMGFPRERVVAALRDAGNNQETAINRLLAGN